MNKGFVHIVGAGPGDPDLLTVKALRLLQSAEVVVFDKLVSDEILDLIPAGTSRIYAGKGPNNHHMPQSEINELLVSLASSGHEVVRLKGGDPFIFGRGSEEAHHLSQHGISFEVVPGITAASGGSAYAGIPLTHRGIASGVRYVTGHMREGVDLEHDWASLAAPDTTLVIYMGLRNFKRIAIELIKAGLSADTPAAAIQRATTPEQKRITATLSTLAEAAELAQLQAPTLFVIGGVVELATELDWFTSSLLSPDQSATG